MLGILAMFISILKAAQTRPDDFNTYPRSPSRSDKLRYQIWKNAEGSVLPYKNELEYLSGFPKHLRVLDSILVMLISINAR